MIQISHYTHTYSFISLYMNVRCKLPNNFPDSFLPSYLSNPWIWLAFAILAYYIYKRLGLNSRYTEWQQQREYAAEVAHIKKNPEFYRERMEAMERARQKQQVSFAIINFSL